MFSMLGISTGFPRPNADWLKENESWNFDFLYFSFFLQVNYIEQIMRSITIKMKIKASSDQEQSSWIGPKQQPCWSKTAAELVQKVQLCPPSPLDLAAAGLLSATTCEWEKIVLKGFHTSSLRTPTQKITNATQYTTCITHGSLH